MFEENLAMQKCSAESQLAGAGAFQPPTRRQRLELGRAQLKAQLQKIEDALAALDGNPELEKFAETLSRAGV